MTSLLIHGLGFYGPGSFLVLFGAGRHGDANGTKPGLNADGSPPPNTATAMTYSMPRFTMPFVHLSGIYVYVEERREPACLAGS